MNRTNENAEDRIIWIDVAKFVAIIGVMIDHTRGILYSNHYVAYFSYYSVSLFIIILGITSIWSYSSSGDVINKIKTKCIGIIRPYIVASIIYGVVLLRGFDLEIILDRIIRFNMIGPFYYVLLYLQLILIAPLLSCFFQYADRLKKTHARIILEATGFAIIMLISWLTTNYSNIFEVYGGGGKLFGGTYLVLFYIGMWFGKYYHRIRIPTIYAGILAIVTFCCVILWWRFIANDGLKIDLLVPFGNGFNPPSISFGVYAMLITATLYLTEMVLLYFGDGVPMRIMTAIGSLGKHTLYIFLYHMFFLGIVFPGIEMTIGIAIENIWIKRSLFFTVMIIGSIVIEMVLGKAHKLFLIAYRHSKV